MATAAGGGRGRQCGGGGWCWRAVGGGGSQIRVVSIKRKNGFPQGGKGRGKDRSTNPCGAATSVDSFGADDISSCGGGGQFWHKGAAVGWQRQRKSHVCSHQQRFSSGVCDRQVNMKIRYRFFVIYGAHKTKRFQERRDPGQFHINVSMGPIVVYPVGALSGRLLSQ